MDQRAPDAAAMPLAGDGDQKVVKHFRHILLWPIHVMARSNGRPVDDHAAALIAMGEASPWREVSDEFGDPGDFCERHYYEFINFLPPVQRFLYGQGIGRAVRQVYGESPIRVMRRNDIAKVMVTLTPESAAVAFDVAHVDLYFFYDIDVAMLALEIHADDLPLATVQDVMFKLGRAYPANWDEQGDAIDCPTHVEWHSATGAVLAASDFADRAKFLGFVCQHRAPPVAAHWEFLMQPLVLHHADRSGNIRYRQLEDDRMPQMAFIAMEHPDDLTRADYIRLAFASGAGDSYQLPFAERHLEHFEANHCYDRFDEARRGSEPLAIRFMSSGSTFVVTGASTHSAFVDAERGYLGRFRHQHFLLFLIVHFHEAALAMFSDRLAAAVNRLDVSDVEEIAAFRTATRQALEKFLRFTHRYWFHAVSNNELPRDLFALCRRHLDLDRLYEDVRQEIQEMSQYLENEAQRRQNDTVVRLTVVTILGLIGTIATGFLGMNLFDHTDYSALTKLAIFFAVLVPVIVLTALTVMLSRRLSQFLDMLGDEEATSKMKWQAFRDVFWTPRKK